MPNSTGPETAETFTVQCPACATGYRVPADRADETPRLRCGRCEHVWHHDAAANAAGDEPADEGLAPDDPAADEDRSSVNEDPSVNEDLPASDPDEDLDDARPQMLDDTSASDDGFDEPEPEPGLDPEIEAEEPVVETGDDLAAADAASGEPSADSLNEAEADDVPPAEAAASDAPDESAELRPDEAVSDEPVAAVTDDETDAMDAPAFGLDARDRRRGVGVTGRRAARAAAAAVLCLGFAVGATGLVARDAFVRYEPRLAALYEALGTPVNLSPFALSAGDARLVARDDAAQLTVTVTLGNRTERPHMIPALDLVLLDRAGAALDRRSLRVPAGSVNGLGETSFQARVDLAPALDPSEVGDIVIGLAPTSPPSAGSGAAVAHLQIGSTR